MDIVESLLRVALLGSSWVLWLLLALSVVSIGAMIERWVFFRQNRAGGEALRAALAKALSANDEEALERALSAHRSVEADVLKHALAWRRGGPQAVSDAVESELGRQRGKLERGMTLLGTLGNNAPFIGLFGTVLGVIEAFHHLSSGAGEAAMGNVMSGIAEALVATGVGIFVAIPAVIAFNVAQKKAAEIENDVHALAKLVLAWMRTGPDAVARSRASSEEPDAQPEGALRLAAGAE
jgi:biopolymer transport protein ExbB/biopolymer transport protein TolQ